MREFKITVNGTSYDVQVEEANGATAAATPVAAPVQAAPVAAKAPAAAGSGDPINAPMPGTITKIVAAVGSDVKKGDTVVVLEAMKMENEISAAKDGKVTSISVAVGDSVTSGQVLATIQ